MNEKEKLDANDKIKILEYLKKCLTIKKCEMYLVDRKALKLIDNNLSFFCDENSNKKI